MHLKPDQNYESTTGPKSDVINLLQCRLAES